MDRRSTRTFRRSRTANRAPRVRFPDFKLPAEIAVSNEDGEYSYVPSHLAHWDDIEAGHCVRLRGLERAEQRLRVYEQTMERLRPLMEADPELTVAEAIELALERDDC